MTYLDHLIYESKPLYYISDVGFLDNWEDLGVGIYRSPWCGSVKFEIMITDVRDLNTTTPKSMSNLYCLIGNSLFFKRHLVKSNITVSECLGIAEKGVIINKDGIKANEVC